jgi:hypothetical protein
MIRYERGIFDDPEAMTLVAPWRDFEPVFVQHDVGGQRPLLSVTFENEAEHRARILFTPEEAARIGRQLVEWAEEQE